MNLLKLVLVMSFIAIAASAGQERGGVGGPDKNGSVIGGGSPDKKP